MFSGQETLFEKISIVIGTLIILALLLGSLVVALGVVFEAPQNAPKHAAEPPASGGAQNAQNQPDPAHQSAPSAPKTKPKQTPAPSNTARGPTESNPPSGPPEPGPSSNPPPFHPEEPLAPRGSFDASLVKVQTRAREGGLRFGDWIARIHFVKPASSKTLLTLADQCVKAYRGQAHDVECFGYSSVADFRFAGVNKDGSVEFLCYRALSSYDRDDHSTIRMTSRTYYEEQCPGHE